MFALDKERRQEKKRRVLAFILSLFVPGLGQLARRRIGPGIFFLVTFSFILWLVAEVHRINYGIVGTSLGLFILYCFNLFDAYKGPTRRRAPCERRCPAGINIPLYVALVREGRYDDALTTIMDRMPFPAACGRICHHPCESLCALRAKEGSIGIELLKRAAAEQGTCSLHTDQDSLRSKTVGIIGAGPAGLSAAYFLRRKGYPVTVYEKEGEAGGLLRWAIPAFRLPGRIVSGEISLLKQFGIDIKYDHAVGKEIEFETIRNHHDAVLIAAGASVSGKPLNIEGAHLEGVSTALAVLANARRGKTTSLKGKVVAVIGGGNTAFDAARVAVRSGAKAVTIYYRRNAREMPGNLEELTMAQREGVAIEYQVMPIRFTGTNRVTAIELARTELKRLPGKARSEVVPINGGNVSVSCDAVLVATGQEPGLDFLPEEVREKIRHNSSIQVHPSTMVTAIPGIFAAGDITGKQLKTVVDAVEAGRRASRGIDWFLRGAGRCGRILERLAAFDHPHPRSLPRRKRVGGKRQEQALLDREKAATTNEEVELGLTEEDARKEASRCLQCNRLS